MKHRRFVSGIIVTLMATCGFVAAPQPVLASGAARAAGGRIAFSYGFQFPGGDPGGHSDIFTVLPDGGDVRQLTHVAGDATAALPSWSPSGNAIAYESNVTGNYEIWVMAGTGADQRQITRDPGFDHFEPSWSPDGRSVVFERCDARFGFDASCDLEIVDVGNGAMRRIVGGHRYNVHPVFSPDGRRIAFASDRNGFVAAVWVVNVNGSGLRQLTAPAELGFWPDWSPDGRRILYTDHCCLPHSNVWSVRPDGTGRRQLTDAPPGHNDSFAAFSPDGRDLLYNSDAAYTDGCCSDLVVQYRDGSRSTVLKKVPGIAAADWGPAPLGGAAGVAATAAAIATVAPGAPPATAALQPPTTVAVPPAGDTAAAAGAAGSAHSRIAFADFVSGQIDTVASDGSDLLQLTHTDGAHSASSPEWAPDGRTLAYSLLDNGDPFEVRIWSVNADGTGAHQLADDAPGYRDFQPRYTPDGRSIVFTRCQPGDGGCAIWIMGADGTNKRAVTPYRVGDDEATDFGAAVSSDGQHVAFARFEWKGIAAQVYVIRLDGTHEHAVTPPSLEAFSPNYSPDGRFLTVSSNAPRIGSNVYTLRVDGTHLRRLSSTHYPNNSYSSSYSPSGQRIAYASDARYDDICCQDLFTVNADGSRTRQVPTGAVNGVYQVAWGRTAADPATAARPAVRSAATPRRSPEARCDAAAASFGAIGRCPMAWRTGIRAGK